MLDAACRCFVFLLKYIMLVLQRPPVSTSEYPDSKRISLVNSRTVKLSAGNAVHLRCLASLQPLQAKDKERPARPSRAAGTAHYESPKSPQKHHIVLPPLPSPPPPTFGSPDAESPTKGPMTPVSGQVHQRSFAASMAHHAPSSPAPPSPSHVRA